MKIIQILACLVLFAGCSAGPFIVTQAEPIGVDSTEIFVVSHGRHTGLIVPADTIQSRLPELKNRFSNALYLEFGWGDEKFYQADEITSGLVMQAIFWPTESVMHVVAIPQKPDIYFHNSAVESRYLEPKNYATLLLFIEKSFSRNSVDKIIGMKNGIYGNSQFYKGAGDYYLMNTCNTWTAKGLKSAGIDIHPTFKLTAESIMSALSEQNR